MNQLRAAVFLAGILIVSGGISFTAASRIKTPFQLVSLWSEEMLKFVTGEKQSACSGVNAAKCQRLNTGVCDGTAYLAFGSGRALPAGVPPRTATKQTDSADPQYFDLQIRNLGHGMNLHHFYSLAELDAMELVFDCNFSGNQACPAARFQTGAIHRIEVSALNGQKPFDLTRFAQVLPDGPIVVTLDKALKETLFNDTRAVYQLRAVVECFSVAPSPVEWKLPVYELPSASAKSPGVLVARAAPGHGIEFVYQSTRGKHVPLTPDWIEHDWGYTFLLEQTILDRQGDWFQLPPRPFPTAVWIHLPGRAETSRLEQGAVYVLSKKINARPKSATGTVILDAGHVVVVAVQNRTVEIRKEERFDRPCSDTNQPAPGQKLKTYLVAAEELYDADLHLQLRPAYTRGC